MKKLFLFTFLILSTLASAQGNLQFNRALMETYTGSTWNSSNNTQPIVATIVVPTGKVWKIETTSFIHQEVWGFTHSNNIRAFIGNFIFENLNNKITWLPAGSYSLRFYDSVGGAAATYIFSVSGIEFNIVP
jgi:hypothetical protein